MASLEYRSLSGPKRLGDRLLEAGLITRTHLDVALDRQQAGIDDRQRLGSTLVELGFLNDRDLMQMLSVHFAIPMAPFSIADAEGAAIMSVPAAVARRHRVLPYRIVGRGLLIAVADATVPAAVDELQTVSGLPVIPYLASEVEIDAALLKHYGHASMPSARLRELAGSLLRLADGPEDEGRLRAELEHVRRGVEVLLSALTERADQSAPFR